MRFKIGYPGNLTVLDLNQRLSVSTLAKAPVETIHIRLNESDNLSRKKVQQMFGSQIIRKPVVDDGKSLRSKKSDEKPTMETASRSTPTEVGMQYIGHAGTLEPSSINPFGSEEDFENDLEFRILSTTPEASSTPRAVTPSFSMENCRLVWRRMTTPPIGDSEDTSLQELDLFLSTESPKRPGQKRLAAPESFEHRGAQESPDDCKRVKKHPSPDKQYLESLEEALQKYNTLKMTGADDDELDELADNYSRPPLRSLTPKDSNRKVLGASRARGRQTTSMRADHRLLMTPFPRRHERISKPRDSRHMTSQEVCSVSRLRPRDAGADDLDELL